MASACPADVKLAAQTTCRAAAGVCDHAETCDGVGNDCAPDTKQPATTVCRAAAGACDRQETCDGASDGCPADLKEAASTVCRPAAGPCDVAEVCDGVAVSCPVNAFLPATALACAPYRCPGTSAACNTTCSQTIDCAPDRTSFCNVGACQFGRVAFTTSQLFSANLGNVAGADAICERVRADAGFSGTFRAWLSSPDGGSPSTRFNRDGGAWIRVGDKAVLATSFTDLTTTPWLNNGINYDEKAHLIAGSVNRIVFTATGTNGALLPGTSACEGWSTTDAGASMGVGFCDYVTDVWTFTGSTVPCNYNSGRLYCFQQ